MAGSGSKNFRITADGKIYRYGKKRFPSGDEYNGEFVGGLREGRGTLDYANGNVYSGEWKANNFQGYGLFKWATYLEGATTIRGRRYEGYWEDGYKSGRGVLHVGQGDVYEGCFQKDEYSGEGILTKKEGTVMRGQWRNGFLDGEATIEYVNGDVYKVTSYRGQITLDRSWLNPGPFCLSAFHPLGCEMGSLEPPQKLTLPGFCLPMSFSPCPAIALPYACHCPAIALPLPCQGGFHAGHYEGRGKFVFAHGRGWYEGQYSYGKPHGRGVRVYCNNNRYDGDFKEGAPHGDGVMEYATQDTYIGGWDRGFRHGKGVLQLKNGDRYEGGFYSGFFFGRGRYTYADGGYYEGDFLRRKGGYAHGGTFPDPDGKKNGKGVRVWSSGDRYEGEWCQDYQHGVAVLRKEKGGRFEGRFRWGQKSGPATETWGNVLSVPFVCPLGYRHDGRGLCTYEGRYKDGHFHGVGTFTCVDGRRYEGTWKRGRRHGLGTERMVPASEEGDERRLFIGGCDALYRPLEYSGEWFDGRRTGQGVLMYAGGLRVVGELVDGKFEGEAKYVFPGLVTGGEEGGEAGPRVRRAVFIDGQRVRWLPELPPLAVAKLPASKGGQTRDAQSVLDEILTARPPTAGTAGGVGVPFQGTGDAQTGGGLSGMRGKSAQAKVTFT